MAVIDDEIDSLYQEPLASFTAARDALAKRSGADGAAIRRLVKPSVPAWAVNQLFWRRRKFFDRLATAAERRREAHGARLGGKDIDLTPIEEAHQDALAAAMQEIRQLLADAGDPATSATINAASETLQALPWSEPPGRLARPAKPMGFAALAGLVGSPAVKRLADVVPFEPARSRTRVGEADRAKLEAERQRLELADAERDLVRARAAQKKADAALTKAQQTLDRAWRDRETLEASLEKATAHVQQLRTVVNQELRRSKDTAAAATRLEERIAELESKSVSATPSSRD